jgi:beta-mannosidase
VLKVQIETLRRLKYRPTGGFCFSSLNDSAPSISSSILDHERRPKAAYAQWLPRAPVLVVADPLPDEVHPGDRIDVDVHVVSDLRTPLDFAVVDAVASWRGGEQRWRFGGPVAADDVVMVGRLRLDVPDATGPITLDLRLTAGDVTSHNHYATTITEPASRSAMSEPSRMGPRGSSRTRPHPCDERSTPYQVGSLIVGRPEE